MLFLYIWTVHLYIYVSVYNHKLTVENFFFYPHPPQILYICYRNQQSFKIFDTLKLLGLKISDFFENSFF